MSARRESPFLGVALLKRRINEGIKGKRGNEFMFGGSEAAHDT